MKELHGESLASYPDPKSCGGDREAAAEALIGAHAGQVLSREIKGVRDADAVIRSGRQHRLWHGRQSWASPARSKTLSMHGTSLRENWEISRPLGVTVKHRAAWARPEAEKP